MIRLVFKSSLREQSEEKLTSLNFSLRMSSDYACEARERSPLVCGLRNTGTEPT